MCKPTGVSAQQMGRTYAGARVVLICKMSAIITDVLNQEEAHKRLPAGLTDDVLGGFIALQLALPLLRVLDSVTLSLLLRFGSLTKIQKQETRGLLDVRCPSTGAWFCRGIGWGARPESGDQSRVRSLACHGRLRPHIGKYSTFTLKRSAISRITNPISPMTGE